MTYSFMKQILEDEDVIVFDLMCKTLYNNVTKYIIASFLPNNKKNIMVLIGFTNSRNEDEQKTFGQLLNFMKSNKLARVRVLRHGVRIYKILEVYEHPTKLEPLDIGYVVEVEPNYLIIRGTKKEYIVKNRQSSSIKTLKLLNNAGLDDVVVFYGVVKEISKFRDEIVYLHYQKLGKLTDFEW